MNENSPVQVITGQVDTIYDKAVGEIDQTEAELDSQISKLIEKKSVLSRKNQLLNQFHTRIENLTKEITTTERQYEAELRNKGELEAQIQRTSEALAQLKNNETEIENQLDTIQNYRRTKYKLLSELIDKFGDSVTNKLSHEAMVDFEKTILTIETSELPESQEAEAQDVLEQSSSQSKASQEVSLEPGEDEQEAAVNAGDEKEEHGSVTNS